MRTLYLHIGHGKTGSSWLQSCFTLSRDAMAAAGIAYPPGKFDRLAAVGKVTPGNGQVLIDALDRPRAAKRLIRSLPEGHCLFSSELLANQIADRLTNGTLKALMDNAGFDRAEILLFIRDPLDHLASHYQQVVKRAGETKPLEIWARTYDAPETVASALQAIEMATYAQATVWNYSRTNDRILSLAADWLGLSEVAFTTPERSIVNRSLTVDELTLQTIFNHHLGRCGPLISDPLCETLPNIKPTRIDLPWKAAKAVIERLKPAVEAVNRQIAPDQHYQVAPPNRWARKEKAGNTVTLTHDQLHAVAKRLAEELKKDRG